MISYLCNLRKKNRIILKTFKSVNGICLQILTDLVSFVRYVDAGQRRLQE